MGWNLSTLAGALGSELLAFPAAGHRDLDRRARGLLVAGGAGALAHTLGLG